MECFLTTIEHACAKLGRAFVIRELSAAGQLALMDAREQETTENQIAAITCAHCVVEWEGETPESIAANVPLVALMDLAAAAMKLSSGGDTKKK